MIYFDRNTLNILRYIHKSKDNGVSWGKLRDKFGDNANIFLLESLSVEEYTVTQDENGQWINFNFADIHRDYRYRSYCTPKGNELLEKRRFDLLKWLIPTIISIVALIISVLGAK